MLEKKVVGRNANVDFVGYADGVPAKIDTGADGSAVWASDIFVDKENVLHFKLFGKSSPHYTGKEITTKDFSIVLTRSSSGDIVMKYTVKLSVRIMGKRIRAKFGLSNRSTHNYPVLIGRRTLKGKFVVDVSKKTEFAERKKKTTPKLNKIMKEDPYKFYKEHYLNENGVK
jgi:hypothetical protein